MHHLRYFSEFNETPPANKKYGVKYILAFLLLLIKRSVHSLQGKKQNKSNLNNQETAKLYVYSVSGGDLPYADIPVLFQILRNNKQDHRQADAGYGSHRACLDIGISSGWNHRKITSHYLIAEDNHRIQVRNYKKLSDRDEKSVRENTEFDHRGSLYRLAAYYPSVKAVALCLPPRTQAKAFASQISSIKGTRLSSKPVSASPGNGLSPLCK